ncbi:pectinesterase [Musa troglodytarum]|uniref:Pectinesterase n=1 Tax=Musa troglodytarum TaxID=320322 RepID=A0A9E7GX40_9LILI|nr:pectinesterase [Musa troglodytarum]
MKDGLSTAAKVTSNAIAIVDELSSLLKSFKDDEQGFPSWFSSHDRKLLAAQSRGQLTPNVVVAKDGSGKFTTINDAINSMPKDYSGRYVIYVKAGVYKENVIVGKDKVNVLMYGDGSRKTIVTGSKNYVDGVQTVDTATFAALGQGFIAKSMGFSNTAGPEKHQAVALRVQSDMRLKFRNYLGRPWKAYSRTIVMESTIGDLIQPEGWMPWDGDNFLDTLYYAEYNNRGPGAGTSGRVNWPGYHVIGRAEAQKYTVDSLIQGSQWIKYSNIRYFGGLKF